MFRNYMLFFLMVAIPLVSLGQLRRPKTYILPLTSMFIAGLSDGLNQTLSFHYPKFKNQFPNANDQYWNPEISWVNKYENYPVDQSPAFLGAKTIFVFATDAYHMTRTVKHTFTYTAIFSVSFQIGKEARKPFKYHLLDALFLSSACWISNRAGFWVTYEL